MFWTVQLICQIRYLIILIVAATIFTIIDQAWALDNMTVQPARRDITITGYTRSQATATLASEVAGKILKINYDVGQVIADSPFLSIDPTFIDLQISSTQHTLEQLKITRKKRKSRVNFLQKEFNRIDKLYRRGSSPESRRDSLREDLDQARYDSGSVETELAIAQTRLQELQERKNRHTIFAPIGWLVVAKLVEEGELVTINTPIARVADYEHLVVPLSVSAQELNAIQQLKPDFDVLLNDQPAKAAINWINPEFDEKTRKLSIELILRDYHGPKRGGLTFQLALQTAVEGLWVPKQAVLNRYENPRVFLKKSGREVKVLVLGQTKDHLIIADDPQLTPGTQLQIPAVVQPEFAREPAR